METGVDLPQAQAQNPSSRDSDIKRDSIEYPNSDRDIKKGHKKKTEEHKLEN